MGMVQEPKKGQLLLSTRRTDGFLPVVVIEATEVTFSALKLYIHLCSVLLENNETTLGEFKSVNM